jgi:hypothetical protein
MVFRIKNPGESGYSFRLYGTDGFIQRVEIRFFAVYFFVVEEKIWPPEKKSVFAHFAHRQAIEGYIRTSPIGTGVLFDFFIKKRPADSSHIPGYP